MSNDVFDFGFTAVDEQELDVVKMAQQNEMGTDMELDRQVSKLHALYSAVIPLLDNLKKNPDKDYILWPDRVAKVEAFELKLKEIFEG